MVGILLILGSCQNPPNDSSGREFKMLKMNFREPQKFKNLIRQILIRYKCHVSRTSR